MNRRGPVFADRYHAHPSAQEAGAPSGTCSRISGFTARRSGQFLRIDPFCSAAWMHMRLR